MQPIAHISTDLPNKFGVPRQAGLVPELLASIEFEPEFRVPEAVRGLAGFTHLWLIWIFNHSPNNWKPTVRPPRLGGNERVGVFASRSPIRPNPLGLSSVSLVRVDPGPRLIISGADLVDGTPILDIKPYVPEDLHPAARFGFLDRASTRSLKVQFSPETLSVFPQEKLTALSGVIAQDPRPAYQQDDRTYGLTFAGFNVRFRVAESIAWVFEITALD